MSTIMKVQGTVLAISMIALMSSATAHTMTEDLQRTKHHVRSNADVKMFMKQDSDLTQQRLKSPRGALKRQNARANLGDKFRVYVRPNDQIEAAGEVYHALLERKYTKYCHFFSQASPQDTVFGWDFNPLLQVVVGQVVADSKQKNGHRPKHAPIPAEFIQEVAMAPVAVAPAVEEVELIQNEPTLPPVAVPAVEEIVPLESPEPALTQVAVLKEEEEMKSASTQTAAVEVENNEGIVSTVSSWVYSAFNYAASFWE